MAQLRAEPPEILGVRRVVRLTDYMRTAPDGPRWLPPTNMLGLDLQGESRVLVRPSGTEPKLKIYVDLRTSLQHGDDPRDRGREATQQARLLADAVVDHLRLA
jgi:phosphomannomutase